MLHVTFTQSGAGFLRQALHQMGVREHVLAFPDNLSFGPIDTNDPDARRKWADVNLRPSDDSLPPRVDLPTLPPIWNGWRSLADETKEFWTKTLEATACTVWFTRRIPGEFCGFLAWVEHAGPKHYSVVDMTDVRSSVDRFPAFSLAFADPSKVDLQSLVKGAAPLQPKVREGYLQSWRKLRSENAPLRVIVEQQLVSASLDFFDEDILSCVPVNWRRANWVAGDASAALWDDFAYQGNDQIIMSRLFALTEAGRIEYRGDLREWWRSCEIRYPATEAIGRSQ